MNLTSSTKTAIVSGLDGGHRLCHRRCVSEEGAQVVINGRTKARVNSDGQSAMRFTVTQLRGVAADLGTLAACRVFLKQIQRPLLVNNLGIFETKHFLEIPDSDWLRLF